MAQKHINRQPPVIARAAKDDHGSAPSRVRRNSPTNREAVAVFRVDEDLGKPESESVSSTLRQQIDNAVARNMQPLLTGILPADSLVAQFPGSWFFPAGESHDAEVGPSASTNHDSDTEQDSGRALQHKRATASP